MATVWNNRHVDGDVKIQKWLRVLACQLTEVQIKTILSMYIKKRVFQLLDLPC